MARKKKLKESVIGDLAVESKSIAEISQNINVEQDEVLQLIKGSETLGILGEYAYLQKSEKSRSKKDALERYVLANLDGENLLSEFAKKLDVGTEIYGWKFANIEKVRDAKNRWKYERKRQLVQRGFEPKRDRRRKKESERKRCVGVASRKIFDVIPRATLRAEVRQKIQRVKRRSLVICIDGSTTNEYVARQIAERKKKQHITFITNDRDIEDTLLNERERRPFRVIMLGGTRRPDAKTYVGGECEAFFRSLGIIPDISFIGVTGINGAGDLSSSDFAESRIKSMLLGNEDTTLRCICMDSKKIEDQDPAAWTFGELGAVDAVITDSDVESNTEFIRSMDKIGTLLLTDKFNPETSDFDDQPINDREEASIDRDAHR